MIHDNTNKSLRDSAMEVVRNLEMSVRQKKILFDVGSHRLKFKPVYTIKPKHIKMAQWVVNNRCKYSTATNDNAVTNNAKRVFYAKDCGFDVLDNTVEVKENGEIARRKHHNGKWRHPRFVIQKPKTHVLDDYLQHLRDEDAENGTNLYKKYAMGFEKFNEYLPFFIRAPSEQDVQHCLCSKCYNAYKVTGFFKKVCGRDKVELADLPALATEIEFEDEKEEVKIQQMVKEDFGMNKKRRTLYCGFDFGYH